MLLYYLHTTEIYHVPVQLYVRDSYLYRYRYVQSIVLATAVSTYRYRFEIDTAVPVRLYGCTGTVRYYLPYSYRCTGTGTGILYM
jgi:hypothetical protein